MGIYRVIVINYSGFFSIIPKEGVDTSCGGSMGVLNSHICLSYYHFCYCLARVDVRKGVRPMSK